jgi:hypothetical protein
VQRPAKFNVKCWVGRLIEIRLEWVNGVGEVLKMEEDLRQAFMQIGTGAIICADCRGIEVLSPAVSDALLETFKRDNPRLLRSALLLSPANAVFNLQVERLLREAGNPARRAFRAAEPLLSWLSEVLVPEELLRARQMFAG